ncbi:MAG: hypothetical protein HOP08_20475 [Cyclobacteriaceae bacterium]|nr:hypothetical protein [Cyclobacteriaceae bacterium]
MTNSNDQGKPLRKLIDIPAPILNDLKSLAMQANKNLKTYIQDVLVEIAESNRKQTSRSQE